MKRTGPPLPIFNKRPRQALLAHPNNKGGISHETPKWEPVSDSFKFTHAVGGSNTNTTARTTQSAPAPTHKVPVHHTMQEARPVYGAYQRSAAGGCTKKSAVPPARTSSTQQAYSFSHHPGKTGACNIGAHATVSGEAHEPTASQSAQMDKPRGKHQTTASQKSRVLTATAKGMQHWSRYKHHSQMLFEVFGVVCSPAIASGHKAKQFVLQTSDGNINCLFWEMDQPLPLLVRGRMHRAVGVWSGDKHHLQCYSVRAARPNEEAFAQQAVSASDRTMRKVVAHLPEC